MFLFIPLLYLLKIWYWWIIWNGWQYQQVLALCAFFFFAFFFFFLNQGNDEEANSSAISVWCLYTCVCLVLYLCMTWESLHWRGVLIYIFIYVYLLMADTDHPEGTLCSEQDVKIQLLTSCRCLAVFQLQRPMRTLHCLRSLHRISSTEFRYESVFSFARFSVRLRPKKEQKISLIIVWVHSSKWMILIRVVLLLFQRGMFFCNVKEYL